MSFSFQQFFCLQGDFPISFLKCRENVRQLPIVGVFCIRGVSPEGFLAHEGN